MLRIIDRLYNKKISSKGMGIFRILFSLNLFFEVNRMYRYKELYFDSIPFIETTSILYSTSLMIWMVSLLSICIGFFTRFSAIVNYIFVLIFINLGAMEYHMDFTYIGVSFLLVFLPLSNSISIDNLILKYKKSSVKKIFSPNEEISVLYYMLPVFLGVGLVYFGSIPYKFNSEAWMSGLGIWLPNSIPQLILNNTQFLLNQEFLIKFLGYFVLTFETVFIFLFFIKKLRVPLLIIGVFLHLGILICYPIPFFALGYIAIYMLLVPVIFWDKLFSAFKFQKPSLTIFYDEGCPLCVRTKITITHFDWFGLIDFKSVQSSVLKHERLTGISESELLVNVYSIDNKNKLRQGIKTYQKVFEKIPVFFPLAIVLKIPGISWVANRFYVYIASHRTLDRCSEDTYDFIPVLTDIDIDNGKFFKTNKINDLRVLGLKFLISSFIILQFMSSFNFPFNKSIVKKINSSFSMMTPTIDYLIDKKEDIKYLSAKFLGISGHGVFVDSHYKGYDKVFNVTYKGELLPMFNEQGMVGYYLRGGLWADFGFRTNKPYVLDDIVNLEKGLIKYTAFWAKKNNVDIKNNTSFDVVMKKVRAPFKWEKDLLTKNLETPWGKVGEFYWDGKKTKLLLDEK
jgi:predicted DCC family thiol-disulfide oxidoreductase YuxK